MVSAINVPKVGRPSARAICRAHGRTTDNILKKLLGGFLYWLHPKQGHWEAICTRHWPSTPSSQTGQLKNVIVAFGGFRRFFVKCLHPLLSRNNSSLKHLNSFSISNGGLSSCKKKWSKDEVYLSLSLFSIDRYQKIAPLSLHSSRMAGILCKQQPASSFDVGHLLDGWRDKYWARAVHPAAFLCSLVVAGFCS